MNHQKGTLNLSSIINYFQDCSTFQSEDLNIGMDYLLSKQRVWLLNSWQLEIKRPARLGEYITIGTWPYGFKGFFGYRNFIMKDHHEEVIAVANSVWVYLDSISGRPARVPEDHGGYQLEPAYPMDYMDRKIALPEDFTTYPSFPVVKSNIDSYNHVNNGQYIKMAEEFLPDDFIARSMRAEYKMQAVLGDIIVPKVSLKKDKATIILSNESQKPYAIIEFIERNNL
jgi:acyl-ACP thioesterase